MLPVIELSTTFLHLAYIIMQDVSVTQRRIWPIMGMEDEWDEGRKDMLVFHSRVDISLIATLVLYGYVALVSMLLRESDKKSETPRNCTY